MEGEQQATPEREAGREAQRQQRRRYIYIEREGVRSEHHSIMRRGLQISRSSPPCTHSQVKDAASTTWLCPAPRSLPACAQTQTILPAYLVTPRRLDDGHVALVVRLLVAPPPLELAGRLVLHQLAALALHDPLLLRKLLPLGQRLGLGDGPLPRQRRRGGGQLREPVCVCI